MRKIYPNFMLAKTLALLICAALLNTGNVSAQACTTTSSPGGCTFSSFYYGEILPNSGCGNFTQTTGYGPGYYFRVPVLEGGCYTVSTCGASTNLQIGAFQGSSTASPFAYNDDSGPDCAGAQASIVMVPTFTDYANVDVRENNCQLGGSASITVKLRQNNNLSFTSSASDMCQGQVRALTATPARVTASPQPFSGDVGTFSGTGIVGTNFTGPTPSGASATYTQTYTFGYCSTTQTINVFRSPTTANAGSGQTICTSSTNISANTPTYGTGMWSVVSGSATITAPGSAATTVTGIPAGTSVTLRWSITSGPCTASTSDVVITRINPPTTSAAGPDQNVCSTSGSMAGNAPAVGTGAWTLIGGSGTIVTANSPTSTINNLGIGPNTFIWTISNGICPVSSDTVVLTRSQVPTTANAGPNQAICDSATTLAGNSASVGTGTWALVSGSASITTPGSPFSPITNVAVGTNKLTWTISNGSCISSVDTVQIVRNALPAAPTVSGVLDVCPGSSTVLSATSAASSPNYVWWNAPVGGGSLAATSLYNTPALTAPATYYVNVTDGSTGCTSARTPVTVGIHPLPVPSLGPDTSFCTNDTLCFDPGSFTGYLWSNGSAASTYCVTNNATVWVLVTDSNGCQALDTVVVSTLPTPTVNLGPDQTFCPSASATIGVTGGSGTYLWSNGATTPQITVNTAGTFTLWCTDPQGCTGSDAINTALSPTPAALFSPDTSNCPNVVFFNLSTDATSYAWDFDDGGVSTQPNPVHNYQSSGNGTYNVQLTATGPCGTDTTVIPVVINCLVGVAQPFPVELVLYPNPSNGTFKVRLSGLEAEASLRIFDLGGRQIFQHGFAGQRGSFEESLQVKAASGMYFLRLEVDGQSITRRIVIE
jgi:PKD repeat protein